MSMHDRLAEYLLLSVPFNDISLLFNDFLDQANADGPLSTDG